MSWNNKEEIETTCTVQQLKNTVHVLDGLSVHHQESKTVNTASGIYHTGSVATSKQPQNLYDLYLMLYVQS